MDSTTQACNSEKDLETRMDRLAAQALERVRSGKGSETLLDRLAAWIRKEVIAQCRAEGRAEGRAEASRENMARLARQMRLTGQTGESSISLLMNAFDLTREQAVAMLTA